MDSKIQITRPRKQPLSTSNRAVVSFESHVVNDEKIVAQDKTRIHSSPSLNRGVLDVIVPSTALKAASSQSSFDVNTSPHMVANSYVLTASDDETDQVDVGEHSGGYFSRRSPSKKSEIERRGTLNTINTLEEEDDDEPDFRIMKNLTDDAFDKYELYIIFCFHFY